jgi:hypothetical protein
MAPGTIAIWRKPFSLSINSFFQRNDTAGKNILRPLFAFRQSRGNGLLDEAAIAGPSAAMPARATFFRRLRRSGLGAWLAALYALSVLALALAPVPALATPGGHDGAVLCSGAPVPGDDRPAPPAEALHCKGCPLNPVLAGPPLADMPAPARLSRRLPSALPPVVGLPHRFATGLAQSRAPPAG